VLVWGDGNLLAGTLSAQALGANGNGGFIETSGRTLNIADSANISSAAVNGTAGTWLLDPYDFYVAASGGNITGAALTTALASNSVTITAANTCVNASCTATSSGTAGNIYINDTVRWSANTLTLNSGYNIYVGTSTATGSMTVYGTGSLALNPSSSSVAGYTSGGSVLMGMASSPTGGLTTGYLVSNSFYSSGTTLNTGAATGFNGQINANTSGTITIGGSTYTVINSQAEFLNISGSTNYILGGNLTFTGSYSYAPVAYEDSRAFRGNINGLGHKVSGLAIVGTLTNKYEGLIGYMIGGSLSNIGVSGTISTKTQSAAGGLVGKIYSDSGSATLKNSYSSVAISLTSSDTSNVGGLVGQLYGVKASNIYSTGNISGASATGANKIGGLIGLSITTNTILNAFATGAVTVGHDASRIGGLIGDFGYAANSGSTTLTNAYATGNVTAGDRSTYVGGLLGVDFGNKTSYTYSSGTVTAGSGSSYRGAFAGHSATSSRSGDYLTNSFYDSTKNTNNYSGLGSFSGNNTLTALTSSQLLTSSNLTNFTFSASGWGYAASNTPPVLCDFGGCRDRKSTRLNSSH
jgi:hypothetical protein